MKGTKGYAAALLAGALGVAACGGSPTTLTVRVDVPTGPPLEADSLDVTLAPLGDGATALFYLLPPDAMIDAVGKTFVVILPAATDSTDEILDVAVEAQSHAMDSDGGTTTTSVGAGAASAMVVPRGNATVTVHLAAGPAGTPDGGANDDAAADVDSPDGP